MVLGFNWAELDSSPSGLFRWLLAESGSFTHMSGTQAGKTRTSGHLLTFFFVHLVYLWSLQHGGFRVAGHLIGQLGTSKVPIPRDSVMYKLHPLYGLALEFTEHHNIQGERAETLPLGERSVSI